MKQNLYCGYAVTNFNLVARIKRNCGDSVQWLAFIPGLLAELLSWHSSENNWKNYLNTLSWNISNVQFFLSLALMTVYDLLNSRDAPLNWSSRKLIFPAHLISGLWYNQHLHDTGTWQFLFSSRCMQPHSKNN